MTHKRPSGGNADENSPRYFICRTCGRYIPPGELQNGGFCSIACMEIFGECVTCGRYVAKEDLVAEHFCSSQCATQYTFFKSMGPRPVIISTEQTTDPDSQSSF